MIKEISGEDLLYKQFAKYYDLLYSKVLDHKKVAATINGLIKKYNKSKGIELLDIGCGTGKDLLYLKNKFNCTGIDVNKEMLDVAKKEVKGVKFLRGNMQSIKLNKKFDIILSLGSVIGYAKTYSNLEKAIRNISRHLKPGGVTIIEPWIEKRDFTSGHIGMDIYESNDLKLARVSFSSIKDNTSVIDFGFLIAEKNKGITFLKDIAVDGLFEDAKILKKMGNAGLKAQVVRGVKGAYRSRYIVGVKV